MKKLFLSIVLNTNIAYTGHASIFTENSEKFTHCYSKELESGVKMSGIVEVKYELDDSGNILFSKIIQDTIKSKYLERCILKVLHSIKLPPPIDPYESTYTKLFTFNPM